MRSEIHEFREEQLNSELSHLLEERGILSTPETIKHTSRGKRMPDITIKHYSGIQVIIEGKINSAANTSQILLDQVKERIEGRLAQICVAVLYPEDLRRASNTKELREKIKNSNLSIRIISNINDSDWIETDINGLTDLLRRTYENLINDPLLTQSVEELKNAIESAANVFVRNQTIITRFYEILSGESETDSEKNGDMRICRIAALTLSNAMIFQEILADQEPSVLKLRRCLEAEDYTTKTLEVWQTILGFNYFPIFHIAREVLIGVPTSDEADHSLREIADVALKLTQRRAALKHDLMGRIYHRLLADAKYFGAFYTTIPAATLLLKLALHPKYWDVDLGNVKSVCDFRVCDLACGTGTLLKAAQQTIVENYIHFSAKPDISSDPDKIHKILVENTLWGFDVLPFATHLAASTLAMNAPGIRFDEMQLYCLDHGGKGKSIALGSLDFISSPNVLAQTTFSADLTHGGDQISGRGVHITVHAHNRSYSTLKCSAGGALNQKWRCEGRDLNPRTPA